MKYDDVASPAPKIRLLHYTDLYPAHIYGATFLVDNDDDILVLDIDVETVMELENMLCS
jgi:hypothetical protein